MSYFNNRSVFVFLLLFFHSLSFISAQEETAKLPEYSYTEFFRMVEAETDTIFELQGAVMRYDPEIDSLFTGVFEKGKYIGLNSDNSIIVNKELDLLNVHFKTKRLEINSEGESVYGGVLNNIVFRKRVFTQSNDFIADNCVFERGLDLYSYCDEFRNDHGIWITDCTIKNNLNVKFIDDDCDEFRDGNRIHIEDNRFVTGSLQFLFNISPGKSGFFVERNSGVNVKFTAAIANYNNVNIQENTFLNSFLYIHYKSPAEFGEISLKDNNFGEFVCFSSDILPLNSEIDWSQFKGTMMSQESYLDIRNKWLEDYKQDIFFSDLLDDSLNIEILNYFQDSLSIVNESNFNAEMALKGTFYNLYKSKFNRKSSNDVYVEMKNLETRRFKYLYKEDKSFSSYFEWKINQFLGIFSNYGTKPSKAAVIAAQAILIFSFFYLLFPNAWDEKNKHRIMNRMLFFAKYFKRKEGLKEFYEKDNRSQMMVYEDFKSFMVNSKTVIPPYFVALSKPIYYFSVANFKLRSKILSKTDILKGKWAGLKPSRKVSTSIIMAFWLIGILLYDLFVKFFNALMLSINTFSTLGFGEIPIKGIPRYLAIIEGFIGWFMLTIFSVSLISQLLN